MQNTPFLWYVTGQLDDLDELVKDANNTRNMKKIKRSSILTIRQRYSMIVLRST
ncbi:5256_t:CDS:1, partial [Acaulospora colombiana]